MFSATAGWLRHFNPPPLRPSKPGYRNRYAVNVIARNCKRSICRELLGGSFMPKLRGQIPMLNVLGPHAVEIMLDCSDALGQRRDAAIMPGNERSAKVWAMFDTVCLIRHNRG